jgi:hypothetical protein
MRDCSIRTRSVKALTKALAFASAWFGQQELVAARFAEAVQPITTSLEAFADRKGAAF